MCGQQEQPEQISIHALREEGDGKPRPWRKHHIISIHALREEGDAPSGRNTPDIPNFYPRPPRGGRPLRFAVTAKRQKDFYPRPPRGGRRQGSRPDRQAHAISIHALREEGDRPARRLGRRERNFYPRPPRGGRRELERSVGGHIQISIHALREEGDVVVGSVEMLKTIFLSTPSARRATDYFTSALPSPQFLSTPSARRATCNHDVQDWFRVFLSTPSARRATVAYLSWFDALEISIHALREEGDRNTGDSGRRGGYFYPRPPRGGRPMAENIIGRFVIISIHALREEGDFLGPTSICDIGDFYPRPPRGGRRRCTRKATQ